MRKILTLAFLGCVLAALVWAVLALEGAGSAPQASVHGNEIRELLRRIAQRMPDENVYTGSREARALRAKLAANDEATPSERVELLHRAGVAELRLGNVQRATDHYEAALALVDETTIDAQKRAQLLFDAAIAWLQFGERQNCCYAHTPDHCIYPVQGTGVHEHRRGSEKAAGYFAAVVDLLPEDDRLWLSSTWLLNVAHMTLGSWPQGVPARARIDPTRRRSKLPFPRLRNVAGDVGLDAFDMAGGAVVEDFDGDGLLDVMTSCWSPVAPMHVYRNLGNGRFEERTAQAGLDGMLGGLNLVQADYDNDGDVDVLVLRGAWLGGKGRHPNSLLRNDGSGRFDDVTLEAGLGDEHFPTQTAAWADYDNDGDLDLYVGNESSGTTLAPCQLFENRGNGTFRETANAAGVRNLGMTKGVAWGDYDGDGFADLYVSNLGAKNRLYRNDRRGGFNDVAERLGVTGPSMSFPVWFWDFDNDGFLDLYAPSYEAMIADLAAWHLGREPESEPSCLYRGNGQGGFEEVAAAYGLTQPVPPMGCNFGDLNGDGFLDFYLGTGNIPFETLLPNLMYVNQGGRRFEDVTVTAGLGHLQKGHGVSFADIDNDGDLDIFSQLGGAYPGDRFKNALYENPGFGHRSLTLMLEGRSSNRCAIGARILVRVQGASGEVRSIYRHVGTGGSFGGNPLRQTIGLGTSTRIVLLEILWPRGRKVQRFSEVALDTAYKVVEDAPTLVRVPLRRVKLGGTP